MHDRKVDVVERPDADELCLAAQAFDLPLGDQTPLELDLAVLLRRDAEEHDAAVERRSDLRVGEGERRAHDAGELGVVPARVGGLGLGVGMGVLGNAQGVELADKGDRGTGSGGARLAKIPFDAGQGEPLVRLDTLRPQRPRKPLGGPKLLVAELGVVKDVAGERDDVAAPPVDELDDTLLDAVHTAPVSPCLTIRTLRRL